MFVFVSSHIKCLNLYCAALSIISQLQSVDCLNLDEVHSELMSVLLSRYIHKKILNFSSNLTNCGAAKLYQV